VAETTVRRLLWCGFRRTCKAMEQVYQCWWRICREINAFSRFEYHVLRFTSICDLFTDFPSYNIASYLPASHHWCLYTTCFDLHWSISGVSSAILET
jgi:hypothetical protein